MPRHAQTPTLSNDFQAKPHPLKRSLRALSVVLLASTALVGLGQAQAQTINTTGIVIDGVSGGPYGSDFWTSSTSVGFTAPGELTISNGGILRGPAANYVAHVGNRGAGTATITGAGSRWYDINQFRVGWSDTGTLNILDGGEASTRDALVGGYYNGNGEVNVSNPGSRLLVSNILSLGDRLNARGVLNISDGGSVSSTYASVGRATQQDNRVNISGASSNWTVTSGAMQVGGAGWGTLTLTDGGTLTSASRVDLAFRDTARGTINFGAAAGDPALAPGTLTSDEIRFGAGTGLIVFNHTDGGFALASDITGSGSLEVRAGTTILSGANSFTGQTRMMGGTLRAGGAGALSGGARYTFTGGVLDLNGHNTSAAELSGSGGSITLNGAQLTLNQTNATSFGGSISGTGGLHFTGSGSLTLTGANSFTSARVSNGVLRAGSAGAFASNGAYIVDGGVLDLNGFSLTMGSLTGSGGTVSLGSAGLTIDQSTDTSFGGAITGSGAVQFAGSGSLTLSGANSFGTARVSNGVLRAGSADALTRNASYIIDGGILDLNGFNLTMGSLSGTGGALALGAADVTLSPVGDESFAGAITGAGGLTFNGPGSLTLSGASSYTGKTTLTGGTLRAGAAGAFSNGSLFVLTGGILDLNGNDQTFAGLSGTGGTIKLGAANVTLNTTGEASFGGVMTGTGGVILNGPGSLTLTGNNSFGAARVSNGVLRAGAADAFTQNASYIIDGGVLDLNGFNLTMGSLSGTGGALALGAADVTLSPVGDESFGGSITGSGAVIFKGPGSLTLTGANSYTGGTVVEGGVLRAGSLRAFVNDTAYTIKGGVLDLNGFNLYMAELSGSGGTVDLGTAGLTITQDKTTEFGGAFAGSGFLVLDGSGAMSLTGATTAFTGDLLVKGSRLDILNAFSGTNATIGGLPEQPGRVSVSGADADWTLGGFLDIGSNGPGALTLTEGGAVTVAGPVRLSNGGVINFGAAAGETAGAVGLLTAESISFGAGGGQLVFNHTAQDFTFASGITGPGKVEVYSGTTVLTGRNTYSGDTIVEGGVLRAGSVSGFSNNSRYTINGGLLDLNGFNLFMDGLSGAGGTVALGDGGLTITQDSESEFGGAFTGSGFLVIDGAGRLTLSGATTEFAGGVQIRNGAVDILNTFTSASAVIGGSLTQTGQVNVTGANAHWMLDGFLELGTLGPGGLTVSEGGAVSVAGPIVLADGGVINFGAAKGQDANAAGFVETSAVRFGADTARLVFNHTDDAYVFDADITGQGGVEILSGTTVLTGANAYTGGTWVEGGALIVNSAIGVVEVGAEGRLGGNGQVGDAVVNGVIAPGNSIGALSVNGDLTFGAGAVYEVEVGGQGFTAGVNNDLLTVSGGVTIEDGATLAILGQGDRSDFDLVNTYTVLQSGSGVTGGFSTVTDAFAFMDSYLEYEGGNLRVVLQRNDIAFTDVAVTGNQRAAAQGLDSLPANSTLRRTILGLYETEAPEVFDALSGEIHASVQTALVGEAEHVQRGLFSRLDGRREGGALWVQALGSWGEADGQHGAQDIETTSTGVLFGVDHEWSGLTLGLAGGYIRSDHERQRFDATVDADSYYLGAYAGREFGALSVRVNGAYGHHTLSSDRRLSLAGQSEQLKARYDATSLQAAAEASWRLETAPSDVEPFARLSYVHLDADSVSETGGMAALNGQADAVEALTSTLGLRASDAIELAGVRAYLTGQLGWRHAYGDLASEAMMAFDGGEAFRISGAAQSRDAAEIGARAAFDLFDRADLSVAYSGALGDSTEQHSLSLRVRLGF